MKYIGRIHATHYLDSIDVKPVHCGCHNPRGGKTWRFEELPKPFKFILCNQLTALQSSYTAFDSDIYICASACTGGIHTVKAIGYWNIYSLELRLAAPCRLHGMPFMKYEHIYKMHVRFIYCLANCFSLIQLNFPVNHIFDLENCDDTKGASFATRK